MKRWGGGKKKKKNTAQQIRELCSQNLPEKRTIKVAADT